MEDRLTSLEWREEGWGGEVDEESPFGGVGGVEWGGGGGIVVVGLRRLRRSFERERERES